MVTRGDHKEEKGFSIQGKTPHSPREWMMKEKAADDTAHEEAYHTFRRVQAESS